MRDITVCKKCDFFCENEVFPKLRVLETDFILTESNLRYFYRRHNCHFETLGVKTGRDLMKTEYYKLDVPSECLYKFEHDFYTLSNECNDVDYSIKRHFRKKRTCQHCGSTIPNVKRCPKCGYDYFETYKPYNEKAILVNAVILFALFAILIAWMVAR